MGLSTRSPGRTGTFTPTSHAGRSGARSLPEGAGRPFRLTKTRQMRPAPVVAVVDDDESVRRAINALLRSVGFRVAAFASAEEFLGSKGLGRTECLILDLQMPGMDGLQLQRRLNLDGHRVPIVILTPHGDAGARARAMDGGAAALLLKPLDADSLLATVRRGDAP